MFVTVPQPPPSSNLESPHKRPKLTPNLLPCAIQHNGPVSDSRRYWDPKTYHPPAPKHAESTPEIPPESTDKQQELALSAAPTNEATTSKNPTENEATDSNKLDSETTSIPVSSEPSTQIAHFRGRKLLGRTVTLPAAYRGVVAYMTGETRLESREADTAGSHAREQGAGWKRRRAPVDEGEEDDDEEPELPTEVKVMQEVGEFESFVVWGHEAVPGSEDKVIRGVEEWIGFAEKMNAH